MHLLSGFFAVVTLCVLVAGDGGGGALARMQKMKEKRTERLRKHFERDVVEIDAEPLLVKRSTPFLNAKSKKFAVDGSTLPDVDWDVGESYAGNLPISDHPDETRQLYFWFFPSTNEAAKNEITIWLQGGPGGASTGGLLLENGPILYQPGTAKPIRNAFAWTNLTNMVWVDQPVGTGFSVGKPNITNEYELTTQFMGFYKNFVDTFQMQGYKVYLAGESYGGYYIPYIANGFVDANDTEYFNLKGAAINDPIIGNEIIQFEGVAMQYLKTWSQVFGFDAETMAKFEAQNKECGYDTYLEKYFTFPPPPGPFPGIFGEADYDDKINLTRCDIQDAIIAAETELNPCFNIDHIFDTCPALYDPLGPLLSYSAPGPTIYYNRPDVQKAIHAPPGVTWYIESPENVFVGKKETWEAAYHDDSFAPATIGIVSKIIEATNNIIVGVGGLDFQLPANGTLFVFQNMTWNGVQGFSAYPNKTLYVPKYPNPHPAALSGSGNMGTWTSERGLTFYISSFAGHEDPWYTPGVAYRVVQTLLGRIPDLSSKGNF